MWAKIFTRKSTKNTCRRSIHHEIKPLKPEDFDDIFGEPPRCIFSRHSSVVDEPSDYFDDDMFLRHGAEKNGQTRKLAGPVIVPAWNPSKVMQQGYQDTPDFPYSRPSFAGKQFTDYEQQTENFTSTPFSLSRRASSPESMSRGDYSYSSVKVSVGDEHDYTNKFHKNDDDDDDDDDDSVDDDNEIIRFNVFEFSYSCQEGTDEGVGVDEAIAWAKESYQSHTSSAEMTDMADERVDESEPLHLQGREMKMMEEGIKLWSCGKERNIELLLCTLQDILWPNSGWCPIPPTNLYESSNVKKAYQRARLRLHPDKLQQRGATLSQKYIAERIFLILQEAWDAYISQDIIISSRG
ncbi:hypothetical protein POM88_035080 [Heracleum sosnowskyi]|uniref:Uncharacterized protein n=1 Tax=Heracleum sosnowskyi TaxID=360622 RepID=A0AAD8MEB0_9APIA|nr:hypothetical protein POM88_035080 [Heracleum sosnowskyi]